MCGKEGKILIVPPDQSKYYCLECLTDRFENTATVKDIVLIRGKIGFWLEELGHKIETY